jgi:pyocin large subunit-like protein
MFSFWTKTGLTAMDSRTVALMGVLALGAVGFAACDKGANAPARTHAADDGAARSGGYASGDAGYQRGGTSSGGGYDRDSYARRDTPRQAAPLVDGVPMWSDNRRHTAEENADYHFHRDGPDFGAADVKDYVAKAHHFMEHPPADIETVSRPNGDKLLYDAKTNTFAVERKDGAPRTMFKPRDGAAYWKEQQAKAASGDEGYSHRQSGGSDNGDGA